jgi:predicted nucleotidyltransferase
VKECVSIGGVRVAADFEAVRHASKCLADDARQELPVDKAFLFGSYAKGTATELSGVDVCFFLRDYGGKERVDMIIQLLKMCRKYDAFFEPIVFPTSEIERGNPFVNEILRTGQEI